MNIEQNEIPKLRTEHKADVAALEKKLLMMEVYQRKANLLFYGIIESKDENVYEKLRNVFIDLGIPSEEAARVMIVNAHRLPRRSRDADGSAADQGPDPIIAKFAIMRDRQQVIDAYQARSKKPTDGHDPATSSGRARSRISVRTDLPLAMKFRRGKLATIAYNLRKEKSLSTKFFVRGKDVILQFKKKSDREWKTYTDVPAVAENK